MKRKRVYLLLSDVLNSEYDGEEYFVPYGHTCEILDIINYGICRYRLMPSTFSNGKIENPFIQKHEYYKDVIGHAFLNEFCIANKKNRELVKRIISLDEKLSKARKSITPVDKNDPFLIYNNGRSIGWDQVNYSKAEGKN